MFRPIIRVPPNSCKVEGRMHWGRLPDLDSLANVLREGGRRGVKLSIDFPTLADYA
jgi:hypothetical protein